MLNQRIIIVCSRYNESVTKILLNGALAVLSDHGIAKDVIDVVHVPGAFEISTAAYVAAEKKEVAAVICLGAVIRGETPHFDYICGAVAEGVTRAGQDFKKPVTFGVITANTSEQAFERAGGRAGNKGSEAATAALDLLESLKTLEK